MSRYAEPSNLGRLFAHLARGESCPKHEKQPPLQCVEQDGVTLCGGTMVEGRWNRYWHNTWHIDPEAAGEAAAR